MRELQRPGHSAVGLGVVALCLMAGLAARAVRYGFIEPVELGNACEITGPWWCGIRTGLIWVTRWGGFGWTALLLAALALWRARGGARRHGLDWAALGVGSVGLVLYNAAPSAVAVCAAGLLLVARPEPSDDERSFPPRVTEPGGGQQHTT